MMEINKILMASFKASFLKPTGLRWKGKKLFLFLKGDG